MYDSGVLSKKVCCVQVLKWDSTCALAEYLHLSSGNIFQKGEKQDAVVLKINKMKQVLKWMDSVY
jgi:hypothetical protein